MCFHVAKRIVFPISLLTAFSLLTPWLLPAQPIVCYFGDSITEGWMDAERHPALAYPALTDSLLSAMGIRIRSVVAARGGESTADALLRVDSEVVRLDPDVVVFAFGANDFFIWGDPPAPRVSLDRFRYNCRVLFGKLTASGARLLVLAPLPVVADRFYRYFDSTLYAPHGGVEALRADYADAVAVTAAEFETALLLRTDSTFFADSSLLGFDGVHPLAEGHRRIAEVLSAGLHDAIMLGRRQYVPLEGFEVFPLPYQRFRQDVSSIGFDASEAGEYILRIHDAGGRQVRKIVYYVPSPGNHRIFWNGRDGSGTMIAAGAYTLSLHSYFRVYRTQRILVL